MCHLLVLRDGQKRGAEIVRTVRTYGGERLVCRAPSYIHGIVIGVNAIVGITSAVALTVQCGLATQKLVDDDLGVLLLRHALGPIDLEEALCGLEEAFGLRDVAAGWLSWLQPELIVERHRRCGKRQQSAREARRMRESRLVAGP